MPEDHDGSTVRGAEREGGEGDGSDGTGSTGGNIGTEMPPGYLEPGLVPGEVIPGEVPVIVGDVSCVKGNGTPASGGGGGNGVSGTSTVPGMTVADIAPDCTSNTSSPTNGQGTVQLDAVVRRRGTTAFAADTETESALDSPGSLTSGQEAFGARLVADTCLNPQVVIAWMLSEESSTAAQGRQAGNDNGPVNIDNDWLNIAIDGNTYRGTSTTIWSNPITAADATAGWIADRDTVPGWSAGPGTTKILEAAEQSPRARCATPQTSTPCINEIHAIQWSGWVSGKPSVESYPTMLTFYANVSGLTLPTVAGGTSLAAAYTGTGGLTLTELVSELPTVTPGEMSQLTTQDLLNAVPQLEGAVEGEPSALTPLGGAAAQSGVPIIGAALLTSQYAILAPGNQAILLKSGMVAAPANWPAQVRELIAAANEIDTYPYPGYPNLPPAHYDGQNLSKLWPAYDCSGSSSFVLYAAGMRGVIATDSSGLEGYSANGPGSYVTIYANSGHVHIVIRGGLNFDTALGGGGGPPAAPDGGPRWTTWQGDEAGYDVSHPQGF